MCRRQKRKFNFFNPSFAYRKKLLWLESFAPKVSIRSIFQNSAFTTTKMFVLFCSRPWTRVFRRVCPYWQGWIRTKSTCYCVIARNTSRIESEYCAVTDTCIECIKENAGANDSINLFENDNQIILQFTSMFYVALN